MGEAADDVFWQHEADEEDGETCPTCHGRGTINPLTAPPGFFCVSTTDCPTCDGDGII